MSQLDPKLVKCDVCGLPWETHTAACLRHGFQPRACPCGWLGVYAECPIVGGVVSCPHCGRATSVFVPQQSAERDVR